MQIKQMTARENYILDNVPRPFPPREKGLVHRHKKTEIKKFCSLDLQHCMYVCHDVYYRTPNATEIRAYVNCHFANVSDSKTFT